MCVFEGVRQLPDGEFTAGVVFFFVFFGAGGAGERGEKGARQVPSRVSGITVTHTPIYTRVCERNGGREGSCDGGVSVLCCSSHTRGKKKQSQ